MIPSPETLLHWAKIITLKSQIEWSEAMRCEMASIPDSHQRYSFALGCLKAALIERARSRKGLQYTARVCGAACLFMICCYGIFSAESFGAESFDAAPKDIAASQLITKLCLVYMCGAGLLILSLKGLKIFAMGGLFIGLLSAFYLKITPPDNSVLSHEFLMALSLEASILMIALFCAATYLNFLYAPDYDAA